MAVLSDEPQVQSRDKLFYKINEVSKITGLKAYVLRYWETEFPQLSPEKDENDQRRYRTRDIELIQRIKQLLYDEKFTIAGAKQRIASEMPERKAVRKAATPAASLASSPKPVEVKPSTVIRPQRVEARRQTDVLGELAAIRGELEDLVSLLSA